MREFVLLPLYVGCGVLVAAAAIVAITGVLLVLFVVALICVGRNVLERLGLRQIPPVPEHLVGLRSWWQDDLDCYLAAEERDCGR